MDRVISNQQLLSVEVLRISLDYEDITELIENNMKMTPNVKTLVLDTDYSFALDSDSELVDFGKFSKHWPKLEHFGWQIDIATHCCLPYKLDAAITGLPEKFCKKLSEKFRKKNRLSSTEVAANHLNREKSSILDLKGR